MRARSFRRRPAVSQLYGSDDRDALRANRGQPPGTRRWSAALLLQSSFHASLEDAPVVVAHAQPHDDSLQPNQRTEQKDAVVWRFVEFVLKRQLANLLRLLAR